MRHSRLDWILVVFLTMVAAWSGYRLYAPAPSLDDGRNAFAHLENLTNVVKSKRAGKLGWVDARLGQRLQAHDQLYTYQDSHASLLFDDGHNLKLWPNTLVELGGADGGLNLDVKEGIVYLDIKEKGSLQLQLGGKKVVLTGQNARVKLSSSQGKTHLQSLGEVEVQTDDGKVLKLDSANALEVNQQDEFTLAKISVSILAPKDGDRIWSSQQSESISFSWSEPQSGHQIEISQNLDFRPSTIAKDSKVEMPLGTHYWRVVDNNGEALSSAASFELHHWPAPWFVLTSGFSSHRELEEESVSFDIQWQHPLAQEFELELKSLEETRIIPLRSLSRTFEFSQIGRWEIRVRALGEIASTWSEPLVVNIVSPKEIAIIEPQGLAKLEVTKPGDKINFRFEGSGEIEIARDPDFSQMVLSRSASQEFSWAVNELGTYYWRVRAGARSSAIQKIEVVPGAILPPPTLERAPSEQHLKMLKPSSFWRGWILNDAWAQDFAAEFSWQEVEAAKFYEIEIFSDAAGNNRIHHQKLNENFYLWPKASLRTIWWRVRAVDAWNRPGEFSQLRGMRLLAPKDWGEEEVALQQPKHGQEIETNQSLDFEWDKKNGVSQWEWLLSSDLSFSHPELKEKVSTNRLTKKNLPAGVWYWKVRGRDQLGRTIESRRRRLKVIKPTAAEIAARETRKIQYDHRLQLRSPFDAEIGLVLSRPSYELRRASQKFSLSGFSASGAHLKLSRELGQWRTVLDLDWVSAKAFESLSYQDAQIHLGAQRPLDFNFDFPLWLGGGLSYSRISSYHRATTSNELSQETLSSFGAFAAASADLLQWERSHLQGSLTIAGPDQLTFALDLKHIIGNWYWGAAFKRSSLEDDGEISVTTLQFQFGYRWQREKD